MQKPDEINSEPLIDDTEASFEPTPDLVQKKLPKVTRFNQQAVWGAGALMFILIVIALGSSLSQKSTNKNQAADQKENISQLATKPEELNQLSDTYASQTQQTNTNTKTNTQPENVDAEQPVSPLGNGFDGSDVQIPKVPYTSEPTYSDSSRVGTSSLLASSHESSGYSPMVTRHKKSLHFNLDGQSDSNYSDTFYASSGLVAARSPYELKSGTLIPGVLLTGIDSNIPGNIVGQVRENVYDSISGRYLLIPQGTKVIGTYDSKVSAVQNRVMIVWTRLILPNGESLNLENMSGVDGSGYAGLKDKVNYHTGNLLAGALISKITKKYVTDENVSNIGDRFAEQNLSVSPSIIIRPGMRFNVLVDKDFVLKPYMGR